MSEPEERAGDHYSPEHRLAALGLTLPPGALNALAAVVSVAGSLSAIRRIVKVTGFVASAPDFTAQPQVVNGASELLLEVFGEAGRHARSAVGAVVLPLNAPIEIELIAEVAD